MKSLQRTIESILIESNDRRIEDESSGGKSRSKKTDVNHPESNVSSLRKSHVSTEASEAFSDDNISQPLGVMDRIEALLSNPGWEEKMNNIIDLCICNNIEELSSKITKVSFKSRLTSPGVLEVNFGDITIEASSRDGVPLRGGEVVYIDHEGLKVDFLILRKNRGRLEDVTGNYRVKII